MKKSLILKCLAVSLCVAMVFCGFSGCKKEKVQTVRELPALDSLLYPYIKSEQECRVTYNDAGYPTLCVLLSKEDNTETGRYNFEYRDDGSLGKREYIEGDVLTEESYFDGEDSLIKRYVYSNGKVNETEVFENGVCVKKEWYYGKDTIGMESIYKDGILKDIRYSDKGKVERIDISSAENIDDMRGVNISTQLNYENGDIQSFSEYDETGKYSIKHTEYREDGTVERVREYNSFGLTKLSLYDEKGELIEWTEYTYDENGKVISNVNHIAE